MAENMSAIISALGVLLHAVPYNTSIATAFFHDLLQLYIPDGGHIEMRAPVGDIPQVLSRAVHQPQRGTITVSVGDLHNDIPKKKLQILIIESEEELLKLNRLDNAGFTPLSESNIVMLLPPGHSSEKVVVGLTLCWRSSYGTCLAVVQPDQTIQGVFDFYYSPLELNKDKRCISQHAYPSLVNRWLYGKGFENKSQGTQGSIRDFQGCEILVAPSMVQPYLFHLPIRHSPSRFEPLSHYSGIDASILNIIAEKYNLTVRVLSRAMLRGRAQNTKEVDDEVDASKFAVDGNDAFIAVLQNDADVVAGGFAPNEFRVNMMQVTRAYARDALMWYVPADEDENWVRLIICFSATVWILLVVAFCATAAFRVLIAPKENDPHPIMTLWGITTESGRHPKYRNTSEVLLGIAWIIFSLHVNSAYRAGLATSMAAGPLYDDMTVRDLYTSDFTLIIPTALDGIVDDLLREHRGRRIRCPSTRHSCIHALLREQKIALLINSNMMILEVPQHLINFRTGLPMVRTVPGRVLTYPVHMYMAKGHMLLSVFNDVLQWVGDAGIPGRTIRMLRWTARRRRKPRNSDDVPLTFSQLEGAFSILYGGLGIAVIVALFEAFTRKGFFAARIKADIGMCFSLFKRFRIISSNLRRYTGSK